MTHRRIWALGALCMFFSVSVAGVGWAGTHKTPPNGGRSFFNDPRSGAALNRAAAKNPQPAPPALFPEGPQERINAGPVNDPTADTTAQDTQSETSVAALGNNVVVAFNDSGSFLGGSNHFTGYSSSSDKGVTFTDHGTLPASAAGDAGDPVLARDNLTRAFYMTTLSFNVTNQIPFFKSTDGGQTFGAPVNAIPGGVNLDKDWMAVDNFAGAGQHNIYVCATTSGSAPPASSSPTPRTAASPSGPPVG